jgi:hypothetical protein
MYHPGKILPTNFCTASYSVEECQLAKRKCFVEDWPSAGLKITEAY